MGSLHYGDHGHRIPIDDRTLAHLQVVIVNKLRRGESFVFAWSAGSAGKSAVWISKSIPLRFEFDSESTPPLNREWIEMLSRGAMAAQGLRILDEPEIASSISATA